MTSFFFIRDYDFISLFFILHTNGQIVKGRILCKTEFVSLLWRIRKRKEGDARNGIEKSVCRIIF